MKKTCKKTVKTKNVYINFWFNNEFYHLKMLMHLRIKLIKEF